MELDSSQLEALHTVMQAVNALPGNAKVRSLVVDVEERYSWRRTRVKITGARSKYDRKVRVTEIKDMAR